ncbi:uncharacterized protein L969DRAFT_57196 [Mixia osmundae IAM 14324]|uniref:EXPERA domain-containing protein n=1 Tax=Mixia osmundae (strain CBS 9802 / IAM 14324 / JCM 22182 / KY 12970) TaxID=764103 RepID=G7E2Y9_MIXOS|nr:uncharacterized protein L969DRAFT_57196 [Mixia osmundae IAM 14324]KEI42542.1 hypothetical protein L969DRAFT_57196 [Mixia osmundae IAM 14324]GAA97170.1 hypothetical protein E5Q_03846 [Mixia osmundae IAM 14324]
MVATRSASQPAGAPRQRQVSSRLDDYKVDLPTPEPAVKRPVGRPRKARPSTVSVTPNGIPEAKITRTSSDSKVKSPMSATPGFSKLVRMLGSSGNAKARKGEHQPRAWITLWFFVSSLLVIWDTGYLFARPHSMPGGKYHYLWSPYSIYSKVDYIYGFPSYDRNDGFPLAQASLNIVETILNFGYLGLAIEKSPLAVMIGFTSVVMTFSKTILYWAQEYFCGACNIGHNSFDQLLMYWIIPNGLWLVFPLGILSVFGAEIATSLRSAAKQKKI